MSAVRILAPDGDLVERHGLRTGLGQDLFRRFRKERGKKHRAGADPFEQVVEHRGKPLFLRRILGEDPGLVLVDVTVAALEERKDLGDRVRDAQLLHFLRNIRKDLPRRFGKVFIVRVVRLAEGYALRGLGDGAAEVLVLHRDRTVHEVPERIRKIRVDPLDEKIPGDDAVVVVRHLVQHEIPDRVHAEKRNEVVRIHHVPLGLAHLAAVHEEPRMAEDLLRQRQVEGHQENGPVDRMEADDILPDEVQVRRPVIGKARLRIPVGVVADAGDVVRQGIEPDVNDVLVVEIHRDAPFEGRAGDAQIGKARQKEIVHHLVLPRHRLDKFRMFVDVVDEPRGVLAHSEEIRLFLRGLHRASAVRAFAALQLRFRIERLAGLAVHAGILALVNVALFVHAAEHFLDLFHVIVVGRPDELVVGRVHKVPDPADLGGCPVDVGLRLHAGRNRLAFDLLAVLVRAGLEEDVVAFHPFIARDGVRQHDLICIADVRLGRRIGDRCRNVIPSLCFHVCLPVASFVWSLLPQTYTLFMIAQYRRCRKKGGVRMIRFRRPEGPVYELS